MESESRSFEGLSRSTWALSTGAAERRFEELRYRYGLGQAFRLRVRSAGWDAWEVIDTQGRTERVHPMTETRLAEWYWDRFGDVITERQQTSEG